MKEYLVKYRSRIILMGLFVFLIHGAKLHSRIIGIDTEDVIHLGEGFYNGWLITGRQGLYVLKLLTNALCFQPYMAGLLTLILFMVAVCCFFLLWDRMLMTEGKGIRAWIAGGLFLIAHPVITEQFYFTLQSVEICIGLILTVLALYLIAKFCEDGCLWRLPVSSLILVLNFSVYQAFVVVFIFGAVSVLLTRSISKLQRENEVSAKELLKDLLPYLVVFLVAFFVNSLITNLFFSSSDYLNEQILWGQFGITDNFKAILGHMSNVYTGYQQIHYHFSFGLLCIALVCLMILFCRGLTKGKNTKGVVLTIAFYVFALLLCPFLMTFVCGGAPVVRSQLVLPLITGFLAYLDITLLVESVSKEKLGGKAAITGMALVCLSGIWAETNTTMSLYYTDEVRYSQDEYLGRELIDAIKIAQGNENLPVAIIGTTPFHPNNSCVIGESIGKSFFDYDAEVEPMYYWSTRRILGFLHTLGTDFEQAEEDDYDEAFYYSTYMPSWPAAKSVQKQDGMIIVKLENVADSYE